MTTLKEAQEFMEAHKNDPVVPTKEESGRSAAVFYIVEQRKRGNQGRISRQAIEQAIIRDASLTQREVDEVLLETYNDLVKLGIL